MRKPRVCKDEDGTDVSVLLCHYVSHRYIDGQVTMVSLLKDYWSLISMHSIKFYCAYIAIILVGVIQGLPTLEMESLVALMEFKHRQHSPVKLKIQQDPLIQQFQIIPVDHQSSAGFPQQISHLLFLN